jgi:galactokinase
MTDPSVTVLVINTNVRHKLVDGLYAARREQCQAAARILKVQALRDATLKALEAAGPEMDPVVFRRARHVISENQRTLETARAIQNDDWAKVGELMYASHASLRDDYEVSSPELDLVVQIAKGISAADGMIGCRMTGAGFGGCAVSLIRTKAFKTIGRKFEEGYEGQTGNMPGIFATRPAGGARVL